jgi:hypothetical protein
LRFYKYASPTDFAAFVSFARQKIQTPIAHRPLAPRPAWWISRKKRWFRRKRKLPVPLPAPAI